MKLTVMISTGDIQELEVGRFDTIEEVCKKLIEVAKLGDVPLDRIRCFYQGKLLESEKALSDYGLQDGEMISAMLPL